MKRVIDAEARNERVRNRRTLVWGLFALGIIATGIILVVTTSSAAPLQPMSSQTTSGLNTNFTVSEEVSQKGYVSLLISANSPIYQHELITAYIFSNSVEIASANTTTGIVPVTFQSSSAFVLYIYAPNINGALIFYHSYNAPISPLQLSAQAQYIFYVVTLLVACIFTVKITQRRERQGNKGNSEYDAATFGDEVVQMQDIDQNLVADMIPKSASEQERETIQKYSLYILWNIGQRINGYYGFNEEVYENEILGKKAENLNIGNEEKGGLNRNKLKNLKTMGKLDGGDSDAKSN